MIHSHGHVIMIYHDVQTKTETGAKGQLKTGHAALMSTPKRTPRFQDALGLVDIEVDIWGRVILWKSTMVYLRNKPCSRTSEFSMSMPVEFEDFPEKKHIS